MRAYAALALLAIGSVASCHLFLESRGQQPGSGGGGGGGTGGAGTGVGGDGTGGVVAMGGGGTGGTGGEAGAPPGCYDEFDQECSDIGFGMAESSAPGDWDPLACSPQNPSGDGFGHLPTSFDLWMQEIEGPDAYLQRCQTEAELVITPNSVDDYWYRELGPNDEVLYDEVGPYVFQRACNAFAMVTRFTHIAPTPIPPGWVFRGAGIAVAHASDTKTRHLLLSFGHHQPPSPGEVGLYGTKLYVTPEGGGTDTSGDVILDISAADHDALGVCRDTTGQIWFFAAVDGLDINSWTAIPAPQPDLVGFEEDCCMRVGLTVANWVEQGPLSCRDPLRGQFDWVGFWDPNDASQTTPTSENTCKQLLTQIYFDHKDD